MQFDKFKKESDSIPEEIVSCENYLQSVCEEYDICYETCEFNHPDKHIVQEGIIGSIWKFIKNIFAGVIKVLVAIWKLIVSVVKKIWNGLKALYRFIFGKKEQTKTKSEKKVKVSILESSAPINEKTFVTNDINQIKAAYERSIKSISAKIDKLSRENIEFMKKIEKDNTTAVKESVEFNSNFKGNGEDAGDIALQKLKNSGISKFSIHDSDIKEKESNSSDDRYKDTVSRWNDYSDEIQGETVTYGDSLISYYGFSNLDILNSDALQMVIECQGGVKEIYDELVSGTLLNVNTIIVDKYNFVKNNLLDKIRSSLVKVHDDSISMGDVSEFVNITFSQLASNLSSLYNTLTSAISSTAEVGQFGFSPDGLSKNNLEKFYEILNEFLVNKYFPPFYTISDETERVKVIKSWCQSKIEYNKALIESLKTILKLNEMAMGFSSREIIADIDNGDFNSTRDIISKIVYKNMTMVNDNLYIDCSREGLGMFIMNGTMTKEVDFRHVKYLDPRASDEIINFLAYYDLTIHGHGENAFTINGADFFSADRHYLGSYIYDTVELENVYLKGQLPESIYYRLLEETVGAGNVLGELDKLGMKLSVNDSPEKIKSVFDLVFSSSTFIEKDALSRAIINQYKTDKSNKLKSNGTYGKTVIDDIYHANIIVPIYSCWCTGPTITPDRKFTFRNIFSYLYYVTHFDSTKEFKKILVGSCNPEGGNAPNWMYESDVEFRISARKRLS